MLFDMLGAVANGRETKKKKEKACLWRWYYRDLFFATFFLPFRKCDSYFSFCFKSSKTCRQEEKKKKSKTTAFFFYLLKLIKQPASCYDNATEWRIRVFSPVIISCLRATKLRFYRCFFFFILTIDGIVFCLLGVRLSRGSFLHCISLTFIL